MEHDRKKSSSPAIISHDGVTMKWIVYGCVLIGVVVKLLPYEYRDGSINPVPALIFKDLPTTTFYAFIVSIMFTFTGGFSSMLIKSSSKRRRVQFWYYEKFCRCYSIVFAAMATAILVTAVIRSVYQDMQIQIMDA